MQRVWNGPNRLSDADGLGASQKHEEKNMKSRPDKIFSHWSSGEAIGSKEKEVEVALV